jgi:hypothetical protein
MVENPGGESHTAPPQALFEPEVLFKEGMATAYSPYSHHRAVPFETDNGPISIVFNSAPLA